ncbi:ATP-dependent helicase, partial [Campylobacter coli]|nr:ATP-dependent helicase [Campylobacter coli]
MNLFTGLNESQKEAASHIDGPMLILAGAGSGKTKTITTRLAYMIGEVGIPAINTLTLTFTNKAASVMKNRALSLLNSSENPLLCTFHKFGLLFLK